MVNLVCYTESAKEFGVRSNLCYEISGRDGAEKMRASAKENVGFIKYAQADKTDMIKGMMARHPAVLPQFWQMHCKAQPWKI